MRRKITFSFLIYSYLFKVFFMFSVNKYASILTCILEFQVILVTLSFILLLYIKKFNPFNWNLDIGREQHLKSWKMFNYISRHATDVYVNTEYCFILYSLFSQNSWHLSKLIQARSMAYYFAFIIFLELQYSTHLSERKYHYIQWDLLLSRHKDILYATHLSWWISKQFKIRYSLSSLLWVTLF